MSPMLQLGPTPNVAVERVVDNTTGQTPKVNDALTTFAVFAQLHFKSRTTATAPGLPADGDAYVVPAGATGFGTAATDDVAVASNGSWFAYTPPSDGGWYGWVADEGVDVRFSGSNWVEGQNQVGSVQAGITASTTQTQGQGALTKTMNVVSTCANANDVVTLPDARKGLLCWVTNDGAQTLQVFPASGDAIGTASVNASTTLAAGKSRLFMGVDGTTWKSVLGA